MTPSSSAALNHYTSIELNRDIGTEESMMLTLAHEVRHSWHKREVKVGELNLDPKRAWISDRIQEADCFAYEIHFGYEYEKATGKSLSSAASWPVTVPWRLLRRPAR